MNVTKYRVLAGLYCILILSLSSISVQPSFVSNWDKVIHFTEYAILGGLLLASVEQRGFRIVVLIVAVGSLFAGIDEIWQSMIPRRIPSIYDWLADTGGLILGASLTSFVVWRRRPLKE